MDDQSSENLTPVDIFQIARNIQDGTANPEDAKCLMELFCYFVDKEVKPTKGLFGYRPDELMPKELFLHFRDAFKAILEGKTPEQALGIVRRKGKPTERDTQLAIAKEILRLRLNGKSSTNANMMVCDKFHRERSAVGAAWKKYSFAAYLELVGERVLKPEERKRLQKIIKKGKTPPKLA